jgi:S-adenosylmethionine:tRNA ribosyltransferase-isomerase
VYAEKDGSCAAPTAGLHFTPAVLAEIRHRGIPLEQVTLHVGPGTFQPVQHDDIRRHRMHAERFCIHASVLNRLKEQKGPVTAVGTTTVRVLESVYDSQETGSIRGSTDLFISPGYAFRMVDALLTNFHLPGSTLLMLVCAFAGTDAVLSAYREAVREKYRFYSYGDCMLII